MCNATTAKYTGLQLPTVSVRSAVTAVCVHGEICLCVQGQVERVVASKSCGATFCTHAQNGMQINVYLCGMVQP